MNGLDIFLALIFVSICIMGVVRKVFRQLMTLGVLYLTTIAAGLFYPHAATFVQAIGGATPTLTQFIMFWITFLALASALEALINQGFSDMSLPKLGVLDHALGLLPGIACGLIVVSLLMTSLGYSTIRTWAFLNGIRRLVAQGYQGAGLQPLLRQFLSFYLALHVIWFPQVPPLLGYLLPSE